MGREADAITALKTYLEKQPENLYVLSHLGRLYYESVYDYPEAYKLYESAYHLAPSNMAIKQNFAAANLATGRFEQALNLADEILGDGSISVQAKLNMKLVAVSALLLQRKHAEAFSELREFIRYYQFIPEDDECPWLYNGMKHFVNQNNQLKPIDKTLILTLIDILESPKSEADKKLKKFESDLPEIFSQLLPPHVSDQPPVASSSTRFAASLVVPGLGHYLQGRYRRAVLYEVATFGLGGAAWWARNRHRQTLDDYRDVQEQLRTTAPRQTALTSEIIALLAEQTDAHNKAKSARQFAIATQIALGAVWVINAMDAGLTKPPQQKKVVLEARPTADGGHVMVRVNF